MATTKPLSDVERLEKLMKLAQDFHDFGSMSQHLTPEELARPRDFGGLSAELAKREMTPEDREKFHLLMTTPFGLP